jgi:hypothetical protein
MRLYWVIPVAFAACSSLASGQSFEASVGGGQSLFPSKSADIGTATTDPTSGTYKMKDGFRLSLRMALNTGRFMGHEFGYAYSRTGIVAPAITTTTGSIVSTVPAQDISIPSHQGFYDFLIYAIPEGKIIRPFAAGGVQFKAF